MEQAEASPCAWRCREGGAKSLRIGSVSDPLIPDRLWRREEQELQPVSSAFIQTGRFFSGHVPAERTADLQRLRRGAREGGGGEEKLFFKQLVVRETALAKAGNSHRVTDEALCRCDKTNQIANEQYVNAMLY